MLPPSSLNPGRSGRARGALACWLFHHGAMLAVDRWFDDAPVPSFGPRMVCTGCGIVGADARPNWTERQERPSLTGEHWR
jgi:hypothetical protein